MDESVMEDKGNLSSREMYVRADKIDLKNWDIQLEKHLSRVMSAGLEKQKQKEPWDMDLSKLDIKYMIDRGAFGSVYRGVYDGQDVAVKILDLGEHETTAVLASFQKEVAVWHRLDHPNVTKFVGASMGSLHLKVCSEDKSSHNPMPPQACVVLEYVRGGTLKNFLIRNRKKKLSLHTVVQLALDLSRGLSYLHSKKIVHRDIKTENMLLDASRKVKIADFGVARIEAQNLMDMTGETGTLGYMAPEVLDGKPYSKKCDVYSFGICLWEIYCCDMPYSSGQNLRPKIPRCCPRSLANIMKRCWDADPEKRPDMDEVGRLLEAIDTTKGRGMIPEDQVTMSCWCFSRGRGL